MYRFLLPFTALVLLIAFSCKTGKTNQAQSEKKFTISGQILQVHSYCGGAAPPKELEHPQPQGSAGTKLYIKKGSSNADQAILVDSVVTGENGTFSIALPAGDYCFVEKSKLGPCLVPANDQFNTWDSACYVKAYKNCDFSLHVTKNQSGVEIMLYRHCPWSIPCSNYHGPLPPAAAPGPRHQE